MPCNICCLSIVTAGCLFSSVGDAEHSSGPQVWYSQNEGVHDRRFGRAGGPQLKGKPQFRVLQPVIHTQYQLHLYKVKNSCTLSCLQQDSNKTQKQYNGCVSTESMRDLMLDAFAIHHIASLCKQSQLNTCACLFAHTLCTDENTYRS